MRNFKDKTLKKLIASGKKHKKLIYPLVVVITLFLTAYYSMKQLTHELVYHKYRSRMVATFLILSIIFTQSAWYILAATQPEPQVYSKMVSNIQGFGEEITNQIIEEGMDESSIIFPGTISATVESGELVPETTTEIVTETEVNTEVPTTEVLPETTVPPTTEPTPETTVPPTTEPAPEPTVPPTTEPSPEPTVPPTSEPAPSQEPAPSPEAAPAASNEIAVSGSVRLPIYYAEVEMVAPIEVVVPSSEAAPAEAAPVEAPPSAAVAPTEVVPAPSSEVAPVEVPPSQAPVTEVPATEVIEEPSATEAETSTADLAVPPVITSVQEEIAITWELKDGAVFDSSRERKESVYVYQAVLPEGYGLAAGVLLPEITVTVETYLYAFEQSVTIDDVVISVSAPEGVFPKNSTLSARKVEKQEEIAAAINGVVANERAEESQLAKAYTYDIKVVDLEENEIEPDAEYGKVKVTFAMANAPAYFSEVNLYHINGEEAGSLQAETMNASVKEARTSVANRNVVASTQTEGFSYYVVEFTYDNLQYVLDGDSSIPLSTIMNTVGLKGSVTNATSSAPDLFAISKNEESQWMVAAKAAFDSQETLTLSMEDGSEYIVAVTDASSIYHVGSTEITTAANATGDGWNWDFNQKTLTFTNNTTIDAPRFTKPAQGSSDPGLVAISLPADSKIQIEDGKTVNVYSKMGDALYGAGNVTLLGTGTLNLYGSSSGVAASWTTGNITGIPNDDATTGDGISAVGSITIGDAGIGPVVNAATGASTTRNAISSSASDQALITRGGTLTLLAGKVMLSKGELYMDPAYLSGLYAASLTGSVYTKFTYALKEGNWYYSQNSGQYSIVYNANDGYSTKAKELVLKGQTITLSDASRAGYNLTGWFTSATAGTKVGTAGDSYKPTASTVLYAQWSNTVVAKSGSDIMGSSFVANWDAIADVNEYQLYVYTDPGCTTLLGGYNGKTVTGTSYKVTGASDNTNYYYRIKPMHTSYTSAPFSNIISLRTVNDYNAAIWTNGNSEDATGGTFAAGKPYGTFEFVPANAYTTFLGWYDSTGQEAITDSNKDTHGVAQISADGLTLTASSSATSVKVVAKVKRNYTITYHQNGETTALYPVGCDVNGVDAGAGGVGYEASENYVILENGSKSLLDPIFKDCMTWNTLQNGTGDIYKPGDIIALTKDLMLYAQWSGYPTLSYQANAPVGSYTGTLPISVTQSAHQKFTAAENTGKLERTGYELVGWEETETSLGKAKIEFKQEIALEKDTTLYAVWRLAAPDKVEALPSTENTDKKPKANWTPLTEKVSGYVLQLAYDETFLDLVPGYEDLELPGQNGKEFLMKDLSSGTQYYYRVAAYNTNGTQLWYSGGTDEFDKIEWSNVIELKTPIQVNVSMPKKIQVNLAVGITGVDYSAFEADLRAALVNKGAVNENIKISATSAGSSTSTSSFNWQKYDHTSASSSTSGGKYYVNVNELANQSANNYNSKDNHIELDTSTGNMKFYGYGTSAYKDFYLNPNTQSTRKEIEFKVTEEAAQDAFDGAGFLVNASITGTYPSSQVINGYLIFLQYNGATGESIKLFELTNINAKSLQQGGSENFIFGRMTTVGESKSTMGGTIRLHSISSTPYAPNTKFRKIHIKVMPKELTMWYSAGPDSGAQDVDLTQNNPDINNYLVKWNGNSSIALTPQFDVTAKGNVFRGGFGPLASYKSHNCSSLTSFAMTGISLDMDTVKSLTEVIREPDWDANYDSYLVNLNEEKIADFSEDYSIAEIILRLREDEVTYIGWCSSLNEADSDIFLKKTGDGKLINVGNASTNRNEYLAQIDTMATYIMSRNKHGEAEKSTISTSTDPKMDLIRYTYLIGEPWILNGLYGTNLEDNGWTITKSALDFDRLGGGNEIVEPLDKVLIGHNKNLLKEDFEQAGYYQVYRTRDYEKYGKEAYLYLQIRANEAPTTGFTTAASGAICTVTSTAKDDLAGLEDHITVTKVSDGSLVQEVKATADGLNSTASLSFSYTNDVVYLIRQTLKDKDGTTRTIIKQFVVKSSGCTAPFNAFSISRPDLVTGRDTLSIMDGSESTDGSAVTATYTITSGTTYYTIDNVGKRIVVASSGAKTEMPAGTINENLDISTLPSGTYEIKMFATANASGKASASSPTISKTFTITKGLAITFDLDGGSLDGKTTMEVDYKIEKKPYTMPKETPKKDGFTFAGWKVGATSTILWEAEEYTTDAAVTMKAQWKPFVDVTINSKWTYYMTNTNGTHAHDAAEQLPKTVKVKLQWRENGKTEWTDYKGSKSAYTVPFELTNDTMTTCETCTGRTKEGTATKTLEKLESVNAKGVALEYCLKLEESRKLYTTNFSGDPGNNYIGTSGNKTITISNIFKPETFPVIMKADFTKVPAALVKKETTSIKAMPQFLDNANGQVWTDMQQFSNAFTLNGANNHQVNPLIWKWEMENIQDETKHISYLNGANVTEVIINGKPVIPLFLKQNIETMKYEYGKADADQAAISIAYTMNEQYFEYNEQENELKLKDDIVLDDTLEVDGDLKLDLNGNEIKGPEGKDTIHVSGGELDIKDSSPSGGGSIVGGDGKDSEDGTTDGGDGGNGITADGGKVVTDEKVTISGGDGGNSTNGNGGNGGDGIGGSNGSVENNGTITGGNGGNSESGSGGNGGDGITSDNGDITNENRGNTTGGEGGDSVIGPGGNGGNGIETETGDINNNGISSGNKGGDSETGPAGNGGDGLNSAGGDINNGQHSQADGGDGGTSQDGPGGSGGNGAQNENGPINNSGNLNGGNGGDSQTSDGGSGGDGTKTDTGNITNNNGADSSGGNGGGSETGSGGDGGDGSSTQTGDVNNNGNQTGGDGGPSKDGPGGNGGDGATSKDGNITNGPNGDLGGGTGGSSTNGPGGNGGNGADTTGKGNIENSGDSDGGKGGSSTNDTGGTGGNGAQTESGNLDNTGGLSGGTGGNSTTGPGGDGGNGAVNNGLGSTNNDNGTIGGGTGGSSNKGPGGNGGNGIVADEGSTNVNGGEVDGGFGGSGSNGGSGGSGIETGNGNTTIENGAGVNGGNGGTGNSGTGGTGGTAVDSSGPVNVDKGSGVGGGNGGAGLNGGGKPGDTIEAPPGLVDNKGETKPGQSGPIIAVPTPPENNKPNQEPSEHTPTYVPVLPKEKEETPETDVGNVVNPWDRRPNGSNNRRDEQETVLDMENANVEMAGTTINYKDIVEQSKNIIIKEESILTKYNITMEEAILQLMDEGQRNALVDTSAKEGYLKAFVVNAEESIIKGSIGNERQIIDALLEPLDLLRVLAGDILEFKLLITPTPEAEQEINLLKENMQKGEILGAIVEISMYKVRNEKEEGRITETNLPVQFILDIPEEMKRADREYSLLLAHTTKNGKTEVLTLKDQDNNLETFTGETDKFCPALLVYTQKEVVEENKTTIDDTTAKKDFVLFNLLAVILTAGIAFLAFQKKKKYFYISIASAIVAVIFYILRFGIGSFIIVDKYSILFALCLLIAIGTYLLPKKEEIK